MHQCQCFRSLRPQVVPCGSEAPLEPDRTVPRAEARRPALQTAGAQVLKEINDTLGDDTLLCLSVHEA